MIFFLQKSQIWANAMREKSFEKGCPGTGSSLKAHICLFSRYQIRERPPCALRVHARLSRVVRSKNERGGAGDAFLSTPQPWERRGDDLHRFWKNRFFEIFRICIFFIFAQKKRYFFNGNPMQNRWSGSDIRNFRHGPENFRSSLEAARLRTS